MNKVNNKPIKNALVINGSVYRAFRISYMPGLTQINPCGLCDLATRCGKNQSNFCAPFERKGKVAYFKKINP